MKTRFNTYDIVCITTELQRLIGMRVNQIYDIDNRCYLIRLQQSEEKVVLLLESGNRFHTTQFEWPKNVAPSGFTMKLRKHLKNKRLESLKQLGVDRVLDFQFGSGEAAYHVILELYDRGNIVLTDHELTILNVLRPHVEGDKIRFAVKEKYPQDRAKLWSDPPLGEALKEILINSKPGDNLKKILNPNLEYGPAIIDHVLQECGLASNMKLVKDAGGKGFYPDRDLQTLENAIKLAESMLQEARREGSKGYIIQKKEERPNPEGEGTTFFFTNIEFHPLLYAQHKSLPHVQYESFDRAVDEFFSALEGQKIDLKTLQVEREAFKKLQNVKKDHEKRLTELEKTQQLDREKAELITRNQELVDQAILVIQTALAHQMAWESIKTLVQNAQDSGDPIAAAINNLRLDVNHVTMMLSDPYDDELQPMLVDIDMSLTAFANARKYYDQKRYAAKKQQKTLESTSKALKSAERKTKQTVKEALAISSITKARKAYWFEKFFWFISSDNFLVIGGRDQQQNELLVKRYMRNTDIYVHADLSGASSIIIRNHTNSVPPPRTLNEAGQAAVAYSVAWEAKVLTSAWWVHAYQVSKSAPTGEYLTTGSFMIRGKKNYLLPQHLMLGFSFMFRLEDSCIERHLNERQPLSQSDSMSEVSSTAQEPDEEIPVSDDEEKDASESQQKELPTITEEITRIEIEDKVDQSEETHDDFAKEPTNEESDDEDFPDTHIKVDHGTGKVIIESKARTISEMSEKSDGVSDITSTLSFPTLPKRGGKKNSKEQQKKKTEELKIKEGPKRGQKSKLKKIKSKYKDQDEEDRQAYLEALQPNKEPKKVQKKNPMLKGKSGREKIPQPAPVLLEAESDVEAEQDVEVDTAAADAEEALLRQLSGSPYTEDELLFAVPIVAPYSTLHHYKYKVKLTPGTGRRGKAAKTAVQVFLRDRNCTPREKDLLKAVRDEDVARNFPGKVKLSAPQLHKHKK